ncbi:hypothetical protein CBP12_06420 [Oceanisphaera avium]|uniref:Uncharacterized protein n=2 Tax=Oceanisphaera avium TaxID=1903694 RepID=A0A1Y0CWW3_9GAMM|nr:hypothetical protein CBP12_06420 [Oceanisphaera avium]
MGLKLACALEPAGFAQVSAAQTMPAPLALKETQLAQKESNPAPDQHSCSLSEQLLSKAFQHLDPLFIAILMLFALWLMAPATIHYQRRGLIPLLFSGRRRHLVLCVFRE